MGVQLHEGQILVQPTRFIKEMDYELDETMVLELDGGDRYKVKLVDGIVSYYMPIKLFMALCEDKSLLLFEARRVKLTPIKNGKDFAISTTITYKPMQGD